MTTEPGSHLIILYKGDISALTLFCQQADGNICFPPLPQLAMPVPENEQNPHSFDLYPTKWIQKINRQLNLDDDLLAPEPGFYEQVDTPKGLAAVYLARFQLLDPPHAMMAARDCRMQPLTALIGRPPAEMELLRRAYLRVMET